MDITIGQLARVLEITCVVVTQIIFFSICILLYLRFSAGEKRKPKGGSQK